MGELDEHLDAPRELCMVFFSKNNINRLTSPNIKATHCDVNVEIHLAFWKLMNINYESWFNSFASWLSFCCFEEIKQIMVV